MTGALDGYAVVDLSTGPAGALASMLLSDHGARVVRIIDAGDPDLRPGGFAIWDRGKACVRLDLDAAQSGVGAAAAAFERLVRGADVLIDDLPPSCGRQALLRDERLWSLNPALIPCSITAYGKTGPWRDEPAIDELVLARTGVLGGLPGFRPAPVHLVHPLPSVGAGCLAALGGAAALYARDAGDAKARGRGRRVETSLMSGALLYHPKVDAERLEQNAFQSNPSGSAPFYSVYRCADGLWVQLGCVHERFIETAAGLMGIEALVAEPRFGRGRTPQTAQADAELRGVLREVLATRSFAQWAASFEAADVPFAEARQTEESLDDPQVLHNGMSITLDYPVLGPVRQMGVALEMGTTPGAVQGPRQRAGALNAIPEDWPLDPTGKPDEVGRAQAAPEVLGQGEAVPVQSQADLLQPPLAGCRVLEITNLIAGPTTGRLLADLGADVIKLEPLTGDISRPIGRTYFYSVNFGKRSISVDTGRPEGRTAVQAVAGSADALVANLRPGATERMGITASRCPRLIQTHLTGYGWTGPYSRRPGIDPLAQAMMGLERAQGGAHNPPVFPAQLAPTDFTTGAVGALGTVLGLLARERLGVVQHTGSNLLSGGILLTSAWFSAHRERLPRPLADREQYGLGPFHRLFQLADGWVYVVAGSDAQRDSLCAVLGVSRPAPGSDETRERGAGEQATHPNETRFARNLAAAAAPLGRSAFLDALARAGVPAAPAEAPQGRVFLRHPHAEASGAMAEREHPNAGLMRVCRQYIAFGGTSGVPLLPTPLLGEHNGAVLSEAGLDAAQVSQLYADGVIKTEMPTA